MKHTELKKSREKLDLTQTEMAERLEVCARFYHYREKGERRISRMFAYAVKWMLHAAKK